MWIKPKYGCLVMADNTTFFDVYALYFDKNDKIIDVIDNLQNTMGNIYYGNIKEVSLNKYNKDGRLSGDIEIIIINGNFTNNLR